MKKLLAVLLALCVATNAFAASYFIRSGGSDSNAGTTNTDGGAWQTLNKANTTMIAGDKVQIVSLTAADTSGATSTTIINPTNNGTSGAYITYIGNPASPLTFGTSGITINKSYISVKGFRSRAGMTLEYISEVSKPLGDSITYCHAQTQAFKMAKDSWVEHNEYRNTAAAGSGNRTVTFMSNNNVAGPPYNATTCTNCGVGVLGDDAGIRFRYNVVDGGIISHDGADKFFYMRYCHNDTIEYNQLSATFATNGHPLSDGDCHGRYTYNSQNIYFRGNKWTFEANNTPPANGSQPGTWVAFANRDSFQRFTFDTDTLLAGVSSGYAIGGRLINVGNGNWSTTNSNPVYRNCFYKVSGLVYQQDYCDSQTFVGSVFISKNDRGMELMTGPNITINHCTFKGVRQGNLGSSFAFFDAAGFTNGSVTNNIFYTDSMDYSNGYEKGVAYYNTYDHFNLINQNLYYSPVSHTGISLSTHAVGAPGNSFSVGPSNGWCSNGHDCQSIFGTPRFTDSTFATFNPTLLSDTRAVGTNYGSDGYAGAISPLDAIAPDEPGLWTYGTGGSNTSVYFNVAWTNTGDDHMTGRATLIEFALVEQGTATLTASNFDTYKLASSYNKVPNPSGQRQTTVVSATHAPGTLPDYWLGIRISDEAGNYAVSIIQP